MNISTKGRYALRAMTRTVLPLRLRLATNMRCAGVHRRGLVDAYFERAVDQMVMLAHIFRAGSRIRMTVDTPGDSCARWQFLLTEYDEPPTHTIGHSSAYPSSVVLPVIPGIEVPTELPECTSLRGQPCREYIEFVNVAAE